jgi:hypothetical protein
VARAGQSAAAASPIAQGSPLASSPRLPRDVLDSGPASGPMVRPLGH